MSEHNRPKKDMRIVNAIYILLLILAACTLYYFVSEEISFSDMGFGFAKAGEEQEAPLVICEVASKGSDVTSKVYGESYDWIEIYNASDRPQDLSKYYLSDKVDAPYKYQLPEVMLESKAYVVVFASGKGQYEADEIHTNFKVTSKGETILLSDKRGIISTLSVPALDDGFSYGVDKTGAAGYLMPSTPGGNNGLTYAHKEDYYNFNCVPSGIFINEYMSKGQRVFYDEDGRFSDWVELINTTDEDVSLKGYCLTDDLTKPDKFTLPDIILAKQSTTLIFLDGKDELRSQYVHANFSLSENDEALSLFNEAHVLIDSVEVVTTEENASYGRNGDNIELWQYFRIPTPNQPNIFEGVSSKEALFIDYPNYVLINEVKSLSTNGGVYDKQDWIELYNNSDKAISLENFGLSDDQEDPFKWVFPKGAVIEPGAYLLVMASGDAPVDAAGVYQVPFKLNAGREDVYLFSQLGYLVDKIAVRYVKNGNSIGKSATGETYIFKTPTPGERNPEHAFLDYTNPVEYSYDAGVYDAPFYLELSCSMPDAEIFYTTDGTQPTRNAKKYEKPIEIGKDVTISAVAVSLNKLNSEVTCHTYILSRTHDVPIVSITCNAEHLYGSEGLFRHPDREKKMPAKLEIIEPDKRGYICFDAQIGLFGNTSLYAPQKSFVVEVENTYRNDRIAYPLFPNDTKVASEFGSFVLRNGGSSEWNRTKMTDAFLMSLARLGLNVDAQAYRPSAVYINGQYYGLLNIREKLNREYIATKYGFDRETITIVEPSADGEYRAVQGDVDEFMSLVHFIRNHDMSTAENYAVIEEALDIENYIDSVLTHIICGNKDSGNIKFWHGGVEGEKWRVFLFDLDRAAYYPTVNHLAQRTSPEGHGSANLFDTSIIRGLLENDAFSYRFTKRAIELLDTLYSPEFSIAYYEFLQNGIENEMEYNLDKWWEYAYNDASPDNSFGSKPKDRATAARFIQNEQQRHKKFLNNRRTNALRFFQSYFNLSDGDIEKMRQENANDHHAPTQIYEAYMQSKSITNAIALAEQLDTAHLESQR